MTAARVKALYVDLDPSGTSWHRPAAFFKKDLAFLIIAQTRNNYAQQKQDPALDNAVQTWRDRPTLPEVPQIGPW